MQRVTCADNRKWLATLDRDSFDVCLSDPPYADETHNNARSNGGAGGDLIDFPSIDFATLRDTLGMVALVTRRWIVIHCDWRHAAKLADNPPAGLRFVRFGVWVKPNGAPMFTGDRPAQGWEAVAWMHREGVKLAWNGGGRSSVFTEPRVTGVNPTTKPLKLARQFVALTTDGGPVLDPWCGEGKFGVAAAERGLGYAGCDINPRMVEIATAAIAAVNLQPPLFSQPAAKAPQGSLF